LQTNDNFLVGADPCVRPELRAHARVRPYSSALFDCDSVLKAKTHQMYWKIDQHGEAATVI